MSDNINYVNFLYGEYLKKMINYFNKDIGVKEKRCTKYLPYMEPNKVRGKYLDVHTRTRTGMGRDCI